MSCRLCTCSRGPGLHLVPCFLPWPSLVFSCMIPGTHTQAHSVQQYLEVCAMGASLDQQASTVQWINASPFHLLQTALSCFINSISQAPGNQTAEAILHPCAGSSLCCFAPPVLHFLLPGITSPNNEATCAPALVSGLALGEQDKWAAGLD